MAKQNTNLICPLIIHMILVLTTTKKSSKVFTCPWHFNKEWCIKKLSKLNTFFVQPTNHIGICWFLFLCIGLFKLQTVHIFYIVHSLFRQITQMWIKIGFKSGIFFQDDKKNPGLFQMKNLIALLSNFLKASYLPFCTHISFKTFFSTWLRLLPALYCFAKRFYIVD